MIKVNTLSNKTISQPSILDPIYLNELSPYTDEGQQIITYQDPAHDIVFSHQFITAEVEKFGLLIDSCLTTPITDPSMVAVKQLPTRPQGYIQVSRQAKHINDHGDFTRMARGLSLAILRNLVGRPLATREIEYKIQQDLDSKVLISLKDFLQLPDVIGRGITEQNVHQYLTAAALLIVFNPKVNLLKSVCALIPLTPLDPPIYL